MLVYLDVALIILGTLLIIAELFIPGFGICGIAGIIMVVISGLITVTFPLGIFIVVGELLVIGIIVFSFFKYVRTRQLRGKLILDETLNYENNEFGDLEHFIGKEGLVKTPLRPFGIIDFNGTSVEVCSDGGFIKENTKVKVVEIRNQKIIVREIQ